jgi:N-acetylglucosaminyldiphosphoundecaprenol N-acetyl-beta-D-mannosaminyltransferase
MGNQINLEFPNRHSVPLDCANGEIALQSVESMVNDGERHFVLFPDAWNMYNAVKDEKLRQVYRDASAVFADGVCWLMLARIQGARLPQRIPGPAFMTAACEYGLTRHWRHFFYGGAPGVAEKLTATLQKRFPGLLVAGTCCPPFRVLTGAEETEVRDQIASSEAHLLWVALGAPKQEFWMASHLGKINVPVMLGVGAAFDFHSGNRPWAPAWLRKLGLEWAYRTVTGGKQTFLRNIRCVSTVAALLTSALVSRTLKVKSKPGQGVQ